MNTGCRLVKIRVQSRQKLALHCLGILFEEKDMKGVFPIPKWKVRIVTPILLCQSLYCSGFGETIHLCVGQYSPGRAIAPRLPLSSHPLCSNFVSVCLSVTYIQPEFTAQAVCTLLPASNPRCACISAP